MDIRQLSYFREVALAQNFRAAAQRLNISQSALSRRVSDLERDLGVTLFERHPRGVILSASGQILFERAENVLRELAATRAAVTDGHLSGFVALGTSDAVSRMLLAPLVSAMESSSIRLRFVEGAQYVLFEGLDSGRIDLAVMTTPEAIPACQMEVILREPLNLIMPADDRSLDDGIDIRTLARIPLVMFPRPSGNRNYLERMAQAKGVSLDCRYEVSSTSAQCEFVVANLARCILPLSAIVRDPRVRAVPVEGLFLTRTLVWRADRYQSPAVREVAAVVRKLMVEHRPPGAIVCEPKSS